MSSIPSREVARRVFAREFKDSSYKFQESDDERAPRYALLPTGERANRVFIAGTMMDTENVGDESEYWRATVSDPTGTFYLYAGQYQPEAASMIRDIETPEFVAIVGKPRWYETDDGTVNVNVRPETITVVDEATRDRWVVETAQRTFDRIERYDVDENEYAAMAEAQYDLSPDTYKREAVSALETLVDEDALDAEEAKDAEDAEAPEPEA